MGGNLYLTRFGHLKLQDLRLAASGEVRGHQDRSIESHLQTCLECQSKVANLRVKSLLDDHLESDVIRQYVEKDLAPKQIQEFEQHIAGCRSCEELLESVTRREMSWSANDVSSDQVPPRPSVRSSTLRKTKQLLRDLRNDAQSQPSRLKAAAVAQEQNLDPEHSWTVICMNQQAVFVRSADAASVRRDLEFTQKAMQDTVEEMQAKIRDLASETNVFVDANRIDSLVAFVQSKTSLFDLKAMHPRLSDEVMGLFKHLSEVEEKADSFHKGLRETNALWQSKKSLFDLKPMHPRLSDEVMGLFKHLSEAEEKADSFHKRLRETKWEVEKSVHSFDEMLRRTDHLTTAVLIETLEVELSDWQHTTFHQPLVCRVRADPETRETGMTLTVRITKNDRDWESKRGAGVSGILVVRESEKDTITELTDAEGEVVFPAVSGSAVLRLGKTAIALDLEP